MAPVVILSASTALCVLLPVLRPLPTLHPTQIISATSGPAATRLSRWAQTTHAAFGVFGEQGGKGKYLMPLHPGNPLAHSIANAQVIIIDEMSMLSSDLFAVVLYRIKTCCGYGSVEEVFRNKRIILVGDHCQLPPVCHHKVKETEFCRKCHLSSNPYWRAAIKLRLWHSVRHAEDSKFARFLDIIRERPPTQLEIDDCFPAEAVITNAQVHAMKLRVYKLLAV